MQITQNLIFLAHAPENRDFVVVHRTDTSFVPWIEHLLGKLD